ncbi:MAG: SH3 domain-containing protein [Chloroflexota bacterium]|nr:SH3 domain-containing protein [Chloroflexota bacterium]
MERVGKAWPRRAVVVGLVVALVATALPAPAGASHSWNNYHWGRKANPFTVQLGDNVGSTWDSYLWTASADWTASSVLDAPVGAGGTTPSTCAPTRGRIEVCNAAYGRTGWLGLAQIRLSSGHIVLGTVKLNDTYFDRAAYNKPAWRRFVMCQEVGHTFGLSHNNENRFDLNKGTCMDYTNNPSGKSLLSSTRSNEHPNQHDYDQLATIYRGHVDGTSTTSSTAAAPAVDLSGVEIPDPVGPEQGGVAEFVTDLGGGNLVVTFVIWADANLMAEADAAVDGLVGGDETASLDSDGDGLSDADETGIFGTDPLAFDTDGDGVGDGDEMAAGTGPLTADGNEDISVSFAVSATVVTTDAVNLRTGASQQAEIATELAAGTKLTVTGATEQAEGFTWVPVATLDGQLAGYVAADFLAQA